MNGMFHYYTTHLLASRAGFTPEETQILAYSSTYVDHNLIPLIIQTPSGEYSTIATHHFGFWDASQEDSIWIPFHFFPSGNGVENPFLRSVPQGQSRMAGRRRWMASPNSPPVKELLIEALKSRNLYRIGIALHTFADTWAHQGFTGRNEDLNKLNLGSVLPPIGHAQAGRFPDQYHCFWLDTRRQDPVIHNTQRFLDAAKKIYRYLCTYNKRSFHDEEFVLDELKEVIGHLPTAVLSEVRQRLFKNPSMGVQKAGLESGLKVVRKKISTTLGLNTLFPAAHTIGKEERMLDLDFRVHLNTLEYNRTQWKKEALLLPDNPGLNEAFEKNVDTLVWLKQEILQQAKLTKPQKVRGRDNFENSHFYHWMEAAKSHKECAQKIIAQLV